MSDSHPELLRTEARLRQFLVESFSSTAAKVFPVEQAPYPLLLLESHHDLAGFALSNGDPRRAFQESYDFFRQLYTQRHELWDDFHLSFVFCIQHRSPDLEALYTGIETDVFFCRKYTVALDKPLETELARLPFFPLERPRGIALRPPSAQSLLKSSGTPTKLAYAIVGRVGEDTILQDCLAGEYGAPGQIGSESQAVQVLDDIGPSIRLKSVDIQNFRAYRKASKFDLDADLILLFGPNGFGKTSFLDAIDFAVTGDIGRLRLDRNESRFVKAATHLDGGSEPSSVELTVSGSDGDHTIRRTVADRRRATVDGRTVDRKEALLTATGGDTVAGSDHIEHLVKLFRASHIFSQDFQALTEEFHEHCRLSTEVVSRMLAFEDYVNARRKVSKVLELVSARLTIGDERRQQLEGELTRARQELRSLKQSAESAKTPHAVGALRDRVRAMLTSAGLVHGGEEDSSAEARGWRAELEALLGEARTRATELESLSSQASTIASRRATHAGEMAERGTLDEQLQIQGVRQQQTRSALDAIDGDLRIFTDEDRLLRALIKRSEWQRQTAPAYAALAAQRVTLNAEIGDVLKALSNETAALERVAQDVNRAEAEARRTTAGIEAGRSVIAELKALIEKHADWAKRTKDRATTARELAATTDRIEQLIREQQETNDRLNLASIQERNAEASVVAFEQAQSELQNLLAPLEAYVIDAHCPACGAEHRSQEELLQRLRQRRSSLPASDDAISRLNEVRQTITALGAELERIDLRLQEANTRLTNLRDDLDDIDKTDAAFRAEVMDLDTEASDFIDQLRSRISAAERANDELADLARQQRDELDVTRRHRSDASNRMESLSQELATKREALATVNSQIDAIEHEAAALQCNLNEATEAAIEVVREAAEKLEALRTRITAKRAERDATAKLFGDQTRDLQALKAGADALRKTTRASNDAIQTYDRRLALIAVAASVSAQALEDLLREHNRRVVQLEEVKQETINLEIALDAAATAAAAAKIETTIEETESALAAIRKGDASERPWRGYFERIETKLTETQERAITGYTDVYGPLTSVIQRRLRAVSGFEDILLRPVRGAIEVRVARKGEQLPPTDFFSQSQQQILVLSLFLTACITQTWSSFSPILLDDPVSNFDDLNAYALLDLLGGLVEDEPRRRQFVFALCDERLFQLARQRFHHLGNRVKVYRFLSTGRDGPVVESLSAP